MCTISVTFTGPSHRHFLRFVQYGIRVKKSIVRIVYRSYGMLSQFVQLWFTQGWYCTCRQCACRPYKLLYYMYVNQCVVFHGCRIFQVFLLATILILVANTVTASNTEEYIACMEACKSTQRTCTDRCNKLDVCKWNKEVCRRVCGGDAVNCMHGCKVAFGNKPPLSLHQLVPKKH